MAKPDWGELQQRFLSAHAKTGISPKDWCEAQGLNYVSARRYVKKPSAQSTQKNAQKRLRTAHTDKCAEKLIHGNGLTDQQRLFVAEYLKDSNATQAALRAGYSKKSAEQIGYQLLQKTSVAQSIAQQQKASIMRTLGSADEVLEKAWQLATFDANEISQYRRGACRYCWGFGHQYQCVMPLSLKRSAMRHLSGNEKSLGMQVGTATTTRTILILNVHGATVKV
ncbi:hypothetical protein CKS_1962 [Pantoea stewartii subsp. stewartii DC283]|uniref:Terminase small subunit n=1 Tax=Pantoea stewartii subsp. stewartii DC283 TaxID=660596 RepID=H3RF95_PANSE|nr:hypothetical protein CKS_1962 [Pantoea stewartii subsp. stewartii DC283]